MGKSILLSLHIYCGKFRVVVPVKSFQLLYCLSLLSTKMLYNMYIYNRRGKCLFYQEWYRPHNTFHDDPLEERKLVFGMVFSLKDLAMKLSPTNSTDGLHTLKTNSFTLHHFQTLSGLVFVINSSPDVQDLHAILGLIYSQIYVDYIARNPLYRRGPDEPIELPLFTSRVEEFLRSQNLLKL